MLLERLKEGEAKDLVSICDDEDPTEALKTAKDRLKSKYGDPLRQVEAFMAKWVAWPTVTNQHDGKALSAFSHFLDSCVTRLRHNKILNEILNNTSHINELARKLPVETKEKWWRESGHVGKRDKFVRLHHLADFLRKEVEEVDHAGYEDIFKCTDRLK